MTVGSFCDKVQYRKRKADPKETDLGKEKKMFAVIRESYLYWESLKNASLVYEEWSFDSACSYKVRFVRKTVMKDVGLPE